MAIFNSYVKLPEGNYVWWLGKAMLDNSPMAGLRPRIWRWVQSLRECWGFELDVGTGSGASASGGGGGGGVVPGDATENWGWKVLLIQEKYLLEKWWKLWTEYMI